MKWTGTLHLSENGLRLRNKADAEKFCRSLNGTEFVVTIEKKKSKRSNAQNSFYWVAIVPTMLEGFLSLGHEMDLESTHEFIKAKFNYKELVNVDTGQVEKVPMSTTNISKIAFSEMIDKANMFAIDWFGFNLPEAGQQTEIDYK